MPDEKPHIDGTAMLLDARPETLDDVSQGLGFPNAGALFELYGGGASYGRGDLRVGVQGLSGGSSARNGGKVTEWGLRLGQLLLEQRYPAGQFLFTAGAFLSYIQMDGLLQDNSLLTRFEGIGYGGGLMAGARWPAETRLGFMARGGYAWFPVTGGWQGDLAATNPKTAFNLGGPVAQLQLELSF